MSGPRRPVAPDPENSLGARVRRYAAVGSTVAGVGARLAGRRVFGGPDYDKAAAAGDMRAALGGLKGPLMKVAQILATIPEAVPKEFQAELAQLQSNAPPMGPPFVRRRMMSELGPDWQRHFKEFPLTAAAAASLGQVHKATLSDGRLVACKLQYPNIGAAVDADLGQLRVILGIFGRYERSIDTTDIYDELADRLREEVDYDREARHARLYADMLAGEPEIHVPAIVGELSTRKLLTMSWLEGQPLLTFKDRPIEARNRLAMNMFKAWYTPFYRYGLIHGDPHLGNYAVRPDLGINLLDFGCVRIFPPAFVKGVIDLYRALESGDRALAVSAYEQWGFKNLTNDLVESLNLWASFIYAPLLEDRTRLIQEKAAPGNDGRNIVQDVRAKLREAGGVRPPREFVFMDRAAVGLGSVFLHLKAEINWHRLFMGLIEDFDVDALARRQAASLEAAGLEGPEQVRPPS
ncbi:Predicted unusual protein kinase regulating ubiquinone biosynthesis, AarF/ABC1/UbiB family [Arboricoccus pini]|uniref:Predicted unusual protein kinase regulating ubiquinone biosynthesis, AarF/ABC1/UbiB family n=1 Tax=Arboricoccus pini TaxID=1963835 RepID=A0A212R957_9PROT|nr:AarF/ABC1/UbiB kinase family protein [Arboricoccus pini]SNB68690.1 Predicted unusual protein kinase regulating ubiquinone biosynthesis, AarF/ABC1/UbiB family [Arboricoccus pini]